MKTSHLRSITIACAIVSGAALATTASAQDATPERCTAMMSTMHTMMPMMEKMVPMMEKMAPMMEKMIQAQQGGMMQGEMMQDVPMDTAGMSDAVKAYMEAMKRMDGPMMQGIQAGDPDVAFVQAMIPHHQGAIDMARAVLQFGKDEQVKAWASKIIAAQQAEIDAMREWLKQRAN